MLQSTSPGPSVQPRSSGSVQKPSDNIPKLPSESGSLPQIEPGMARDWVMAGSAVIVDVREIDEHAREHIDGAVHMPLSTFQPGRLARSVDSGKVLILHCRGGSRSADACTRVLAEPELSGLRVFSMAGGLEAWKRAGLPVRIDARVSRLSVMRQVQLVVGAAVLLGAALTHFVHPAFIIMPAFFGAGLTFAGATGTCALATILGLLPWNRVPTASACTLGCRS